MPRIKRQADARRSSQLAAADLGAAMAGDTSTRIAAAVPAQSAPVPSNTARLPPAAARIPQPIPQTRVAPSIAAAQAAIAEAARVTGTQSPADAGASFASRAVPLPVRNVPETAPATRPARDVARVAAAPTTPAAIPSPRVAQAAAPASATTGPWKVQLGAFSVHSNADKLWSQLSGRSELAGKSKLVVPAGRLAKLRAAGYPSRGAGQPAMRWAQRAGCLVTR